MTNTLSRLPVETDKKLVSYCCNLVQTLKLLATGKSQMSDLGLISFTTPIQYVGNIDHRCTESVLQALFDSIAPTLSVKIVIDKSVSFKRNVKKRFLSLQPFCGDC